MGKGTPVVGIILTGGGVGEKGFLKEKALNWFEGTVYAHTASKQTVSSITLPLLKD